MKPIQAVIVATLAAALVAGAAIYWLQEYAYYDVAEPWAEGVTSLVRADGTPASLASRDFQGIDGTSSPIRYRACYRLLMDPAEVAATFRPYPLAEPLNAPRWFDCFDAAAIGAALESGEARAFLSAAGDRPGVDRVVALFPDGRAYAWRQIDPCGALVDADERPASCPPEPGPPEPGPPDAARPEQPPAE